MPTVIRCLICWWPGPTMVSTCWRLTCSSCVSHHRPSSECSSFLTIITPKARVEEMMWSSIRDRFITFMHASGTQVSYYGWGVHTFVVVEIPPPFMWSRFDGLATETWGTAHRPLDGLLIPTACKQQTPHSELSHLVWMLLILIFDILYGGVPSMMSQFPSISWVSAASYVLHYSGTC